MSELTYNALHTLISEMTEEQGKSVVKVRMSATAGDSVIVKDLKVAEASLLTDEDPEVFLVL